jgi:hypothetical protein
MEHVKTKILHVSSLNTCTMYVKKCMVEGEVQCSGEVQFRNNKKSLLAAFKWKQKHFLYYFTSWVPRKRIYILTIYINHVRSEVFTALTTNDAVFRDVAPCVSCVNRRFGGTYRLNLQGRKIRKRETSVSRWPPLGQEPERIGPTTPYPRMQAWTQLFTFNTLWGNNSNTQCQQIFTYAYPMLYWCKFKKSLSLDSLWSELSIFMCA